MDGKLALVPGLPLDFTIVGKPQQKQRMRARVQKGGKAGPFAQLYTPKETRVFEDRVAAECRLMMKRRPLLEGPLHVIIISLFKLPKSWPLYRRSAARAGLEPCVNNVDVDNLAKSVLDGMNGFVYHDDRQVISAQTKKDWTEDEERILIRVIPQNLPEFAHMKEATNGTVAE